MAEQSSPKRLSVPIETLLANATRPDRPCHANPDHCRGWLEVDTLIVGSGYGAAMAALELARKRGPDAGIWVFERGREVVPGEFPKTFASLPREVSVTTKSHFYGERDALWDIRHGKGITAVVARGVGGGSLTNANVAFRPPAEVIQRWPRCPGEPGDAWWSRLEPSFVSVEKLLGAQPVSDLQGVPKFAALKTLASNLGGSCESVALTVQLEAGPNQVGVHQPQCTRCGNCISGCNVGAKGSLDMNAWPLARTLGVRIYSGATVRCIEPQHSGKARWRVFACSTYDDRVHFEVHAKQVILAAGTFGSTEILERSAREKQLTLSHALGRRFSGNGDVLVYGEGQQEPVNGTSSVPSEESDRARHQVGPTIVGGARVASRPASRMQQWLARLTSSPGTGKRPSFLLEDGAAPYPLRRALEEVLVTRNLIRRFKDGRLPPWLASNDRKDPVAATLEASQHHPLMLAMADDGARGTLELADDDARGALERRSAGGLVGSWPDDAPSREFLSEIRNALGAADPARGRGTPRDTGSPIRELDKLDELLVTVHPLGGCCLARGAEEGVVNLEGKVFRGPQGTDTHEGLYVLDGSIIPGALTVNPFLTIAALAHRLARDIPDPSPGKAARPGERALETASVAPEWAERAEPRNADPLADPRDEAVRAEIRERFYLRLSDAQERQRLGQILGQDLQGAHALVMEVSAHVADAFEWLADPSQKLTATYQLFQSKVEFGDTVPSTVLEQLGGSYQGHVTFGELDAVRTRPWRRLWRTGSVVWTFLRNRGDELLRRPPKSVGALYSGVRGFFRIARAHTDYRYMRYTFDDEQLEFEGVKSFVYRGREPDPLQTLRELPFSLKARGTTAEPLTGLLRVDVIRLTGEPAALQVERTPDTPTTVVALAAAISFFGRGILQSMFWSFRRPQYDAYPSHDVANAARLERMPETLVYHAANRGGAGAIARAEAPIEQRVGDEARGKDRTIRLTRYVPTGNANGESALLIHGLAHGSRVFWTDTVDTPLAQYLLGQGYEVWLLDHSLSINLHARPNAKLNLDDLAEDDIPWAVQTASADGERPVHVFAHCIGAGAFAMAALKGRLSAPQGGKRRVASAALHAVTPWLVGSEDNCLRANVLSLGKEWITDDFDPIPHRDPNRLDTFYDALASSFSWGEERARHCSDDQGNQFSRTVCNRMTLFYGQEWLHHNLDPRTHERIDSLVGPACIQIMLQAYFCVERGRLTDQEGRNIYVLAQNFDAHWNFRTLFLHGDCNKVFNVESTRRSAVELQLLHESARERGAPGASDGSYIGERAVSALVCPQYGHMDMLFGKNAHADVFPYIGRFFEGERLNVGNTKPLPVTEPASDTHPLVGPIISRPRVQDGERKLRVWMATSDLAAFPPDEVRLERELAVKPAREATRVPAGTPAEFWMGDIVLQPGAHSRVARVKYPTLKGRVSAPGFVAMPGAPFAEHPPVALEWQDLPWFNRAFGRNDRKLSFVVGSCLYPGFSIEQRLSDSVFKRMQSLVLGHEERGLDHVLLVGDQIYADALGEAFPARSRFERFRKRYRRAFGATTAEMGRAANWLFSHVPTYFAIDDHEIVNNWALERPELNEDEAIALDEAYNFQMHHQLSKGSGRAGHFWYDFVSAGFAFFVFDTRSERRSSVSRDSADALLSQEQRQAFVDWLKQNEKSKKPLFIASGSALAPLPKDIVADPELATRSDGLIGFPGFLRWLHAELKGVTKPIVWLAGDLHCSTVSGLALEIDGESVQWLQICASGLFAPLPFTNTSLQSFATGVPVTFTRGNLELRATTHRVLSNGAQGSFVHVAATPKSLVVRAFAANESDQKRCTSWASPLVPASDPTPAPGRRPTEPLPPAPLPPAPLPPEVQDPSLQGRGPRP